MGMPVLILGVGNVLLGDEGAGVHLLTLLGNHPDLPEEVTCLDGGVLGFELASVIAGLPALILLDAVQLGEEPGTVRVLDRAGMDHWLTGGCRSAHEVGLADLLDSLKIDDILPPCRALVAIQPASLDWGTSLTPPVANALPMAADAVIQCIRLWRQPSAGTIASEENLHGDDRNTR
ncbi:MAG: HyaD/HybD family hydrogenase maturation endopeptidase [Magnetococcales bacterium]|nr:HyaD/HybD family hydrogenase maturation endopeptidase [Magnetococcales bacterium]